MHKQLFRQFCVLASRSIFTRISDATRRAPRLLLTGGATTALSLSFFTSSSPPKPTPSASAKDSGLVYSLQEADALYNNYLIDNAYAVLRKFRRSDNPEVLWRLSRVIYEQAKTCADAAEKRRLADEALEFAQRALSNAEQTQSFGAHKWYAIVLDYAGELQGTKARLANAREVKTHLQRALELNALDATTWMILGVWEFTFADMALYTRLAAKAIYGSPPSSTYEEALHLFERAEAISPKFCSTNSFYLAQTLQALGRKEEAIEYYKAAFLKPVISADDKEAHEKSAKKLDSLGVDSKSLIKLGAKL